MDAGTCITFIITERCLTFLDYRLINIGEATIQVDLSDLFVNMTIASVQETTPDYGIVLGPVDNSILKLPSYKLTTVVLSVKLQQ